MMHTDSYDDSSERKIIRELYEGQGYTIIEFNFNTGKVCDLAVYHPDDDYWMFIEVEQMGDKSERYVEDMKAYANEDLEPTGFWKGGLTIPARKLGYSDRDVVASDRIKSMLRLTHVCDEHIHWDLYIRITPDKKGAFLAEFSDIDGSVEGMVQTQNFKGVEDRPAVPWEKVRYIPLD